MGWREGIAAGGDGSQDKMGSRGQVEGLDGGSRVVSSGSGTRQEEERVEEEVWRIAESSHTFGFVKKDTKL